MTKLLKNYYYNSKGEKKVNCYIVHIPRLVLEQSGIKEDDAISIQVKDKKIIIEKQ